MEVTEEADVDEATPIYISKEQKTQAYQKKMGIDIDKINSFEKRNKVKTIELRPIYKVIEAYRGSSPDLSLDLRFNYFHTYQFPLRKLLRTDRHR